MRTVHVESFLNKEKPSKEYNVELLFHFWIHFYNYSKGEEREPYPENFISQITEEKMHWDWERMKGMFEVFQEKTI